MTNPVSLVSLKNPWHLLATGFGSGLSPVVPGTMGTFASIPFYLLLVQLPLSAYLVVLLLACVVGIKICQVTSDDMKVHDHGSIVWDEFAGFWITMLVVPLFNLPTLDWHWIVSGFILFRFFDMVKPWPICWFDAKVSGGFGIMIDDIIAGFISAILLGVIGYLAGWMAI